MQKVKILITGIGLECQARYTDHWLVSDEADMHPNDISALKKKLKRRGLRYKNHATHLALSAGMRALKDAGLPTTAADQLDPLSFGTIVSSNLSNADTIIKVIGEIQAGGIGEISPMDLPNASSNVVASTLAIWYGLKALNLMLCNGGASGADALRIAANAIQAGRAKRMLVVGVEISHSQFAALFAQTRQQLRESEAAHPVTNISAAVVLESFTAVQKRNVRIYAQVDDYLTHAGNDLKAVIDPLRTKYKELPIGLWLAPGNHPMVEKHPLSDLSTQLFGPQTTLQAENLFKSFQDAYGAHGVLQAAAAAKWLARNPEEAVLATCGGYLGEGLSSLLFLPVQRRRPKSKANRQPRLFQENDSNWNVCSHNLYGYNVTVTHCAHGDAPSRGLNISLIHGMLEDWHVWARLHPQLSPHHLSYFNMPWEGSQGPMWGDSVNGAQWLQTALELLPSPPDLLITHSYAANALLEYLDRGEGPQPHAAVLISPFYRENWKQVTWDVFHHYIRNLPELIAQSIEIQDGRGQLDPEILNLMTLKVRDQLGVYGWVQFLLSLLNIPKLNISNINIPCLIVTGVKDSASEPEHCRCLAAALANAKAVILAESGHFCMLEQPQTLGASIHTLIKTLTQKEITV